MAQNLYYSVDILKGFSTGPLYFRNTEKLIKQSEDGFFQILNLKKDIEDLYGSIPDISWKPIEWVALQ